MRWTWKRNAKVVEVRSEDGGGRFVKAPEDGVILRMTLQYPRWGRLWRD